MDKRTTEAALVCLRAAVKVRPGTAKCSDLVNVLMFAGLERVDAEAIVVKALRRKIVVRTTEFGHDTPT